MNISEGNIFLHLENKFIYFTNIARNSCMLKRYSERRTLSPSGELFRCKILNP